MDSKDHARSSIKAAPAGIVSGWLSRYNEAPDHHGDVVERGAYARTLRESGQTRPVLWAHDVKNPIGIGRLFDKPEGLFIEAALDLDTSEGQRAYSLASKGIVAGWSIGYDTRKAKKGAAGTRHLVDIELFEASLVVIPAQTSAVVTGTKDSAAAVEAMAGIYVRDLVRRVKGFARDVENRRLLDKVDRAYQTAQRAIRSGR